MNASDLVRCDIPADWVNDFSQCLYEWQGLEAGGLALLAAWFGVKYVQRQIRQAREHREDEISRSHNAARLTLPLTLAAVSELIQKIANEAADEFEKLGPDGFSKTFDAIIQDEGPKHKFEPLTLPSDVIGSFEKFVASLTNPIDIRHVAELIGSLQILLARYNDFDLDKASVHNLAGLLLDAAKVKLLNEKIFNYARFVDDSSFGIVGALTPKEAWDQIHGKAQGLVFLRKSPDIFFPDLQKRIDGYKERETSPWNKKFEELKRPAEQATVEEVEEEAAPK